MKHIGYVLSLLIAACSANAPGERDPQVVRYDISESDSLRIRGLAADGSTVGELTVAYGRYYSDELERDTEGTLIDFDIHGQQASHRSSGRTRLALPSIGGPEVTAFLTDVRLEDVLDRWQIRIESEELAVAAGETAYVGCPSSGTHAPGGNCGATSCAMADASSQSFPDEYIQYLCCGSQSRLAQRRCGTPNGMTSCGQAGPGGCALCWTLDYSTNCQVYDNGSTVGFQVDFMNVSYITAAYGSTGYFSGNGSTETIYLYGYGDSVSFSVDGPSGGSWLIDEYGGYGGASCSGGSCSVSNGPSSVVITHDPSGIHYTFNLEYFF